jgi:hypothetical protein
MEVVKKARSPDLKVSPRLIKKRLKGLSIVSRSIDIADLYIPP